MEQNTMRKLVVSISVLCLLISCGGKYKKIKVETPTPTSTPTAPPNPVPKPKPLPSPEEQDLRRVELVGT
jgi:hypothetical protein